MVIEPIWCSSKSFSKLKPVLGATKDRISVGDWRWRFSPRLMPSLLIPFPRSAFWALAVCGANAKAVAMIVKQKRYFFIIGKISVFTMN